MIESKSVTLPPDEFAGFPPAREPGSLAEAHGHLILVAGSMGHHGAAVLAARAALRSQAGLVSLITNEAVYYPVAAQLQSALVDVWSADIHRFDGATAILFGPGLAAPDLSENVKAIFRRLWRDSAAPLVVTASAIGWLYPHSLGKNVVRVVVAEPGDVAKLLRQTVPEINAERERVVREISKRYGNCWVVLQGRHTLVGNCEGVSPMPATGNPWLSQNGTADVLAGYMGGLLAQPALQADIIRTVRYALWQHGAAADKLQATQRNWVAEDLIGELGNIR